MRHDSTLIPRTVAGALAALALATLAACGGGGADGSTSVAPPAPPVAAPTTGTVALLLTDAPTDRFCEVRATIERVDLLGAGGPTSIFTGPATVNVLGLRNFTDVFALADDVPVGTYEKIRLTLSDLALVECDAEGNPEPESQWDRPNLPGNGKLDLNPRGSFQVVGGEVLVIELDMDMTKSLHLVQAGRSGRWQFRPVVFVTIAPQDTKLVRVFGEARALDGMRFQLCPLASVAAIGGGPAGGADPRRCLDVATDAATGIFGVDGLPAGLGGVAAGDPLTAIGFLSRYTTGSGNSRSSRLRLDAVVVELGPFGTFERIPGLVATAPGSNDIFEFLPATASAPVDVLLQSGTRIFSLGTREELTVAALQPGTAGEVDGVFSAPATAGEPLRAALLVLEEGANAPEVALLGREIASLTPADPPTTPATGRVTLAAVAPPALDCVRTTADTRLLRILQSPTSSETEEIVFGDLAAGDEVDVYGSVDPADSTCVIADTVQVYANMLP